MATVRWTNHARERAQERSGHPISWLSACIAERIQKGEFYQPSEELRLRCSGDLSEKWVVADGPKGKATAIVVDRGEDCHLVITVRESETVQQGEHTFRRNGHYPFRDLLVGLVRDED